MKYLCGYLNALLLTGLCCISLVSDVVAARITGKVTDEQGQPLPYAGVLIQGATEGTSTNAGGVYVLNLPKGTYKLVARQIGYQQSVFTITVGDEPELRHDFQLREQGYELSNVVIKSTAEDPAYRIMRQVIKRRSFHLEQLQSFQTGIYVKGVLRNRNTPDNILGFKVSAADKANMGKSMGLDSAGKGVLYLCEEFADYYAAGKQQKTIIRSVKESGNPKGIGLGSVPPVINFYENNVRVFGSQYFISPVSSNALFYYKYRLVGDFQENGKTVYKIKVSPKRAYERCFEGELYIADEDWAIHSLKMVLTKNSGLDQMDSVRTEQLYIPLKQDEWVIKNQLLTPTLSIFGFDIAGNFITVYDNQKVNAPIPDSIFNKKIIISYDRDAQQKDSSYWTAHRLMDLEHDEVINYVFKDSVHQIESDPHYMDSLRRRDNRISAGSIISSGIKLSSKGYKNKYTISPLVTDINFNVVEGLNYAPSFSWNRQLDSSNVFQAKTDLRYGFHNGHLNGQLALQYLHSDRYHSGKYRSLSLSGGKYISQFNMAQPVPELFNTVSSLLQRRNYFNIFERWYTTLMFNNDMGNGFSWSAGVSWQQRLPLANTTGYSWLPDNKGDAYRPNLPVELSAKGFDQHDAFIARASISFSPGYTYTMLPDHMVPHRGKWPVFTLTYQKGLPDILNSITDYDKWQFRIKDNVPMRMLGTLEYNVGTGGFLNDKSVPIPDMMHLNGNQYIVTTSYLDGFQLAPYYRFSNTAKIYGEAHVAYYLKGLLSNKLPLLRQARWYFVVGNNTFFAGRDHYFTEAFVGIDNLGFKLFRGLRIDYAQGWDNFKHHYSGVRVGLHTSGMRRLSNNGKATDF